MNESDSNDEIDYDEIDWTLWNDPTWRASNENPYRDDVVVGVPIRTDLGVRLFGFDTVGGHDEIAYRVGAVQVAGGFCWRVTSIENELGWKTAYAAEVLGLNAFMDAMGLPRVPDAEGTLGPFYLDDYETAKEIAEARLLKRLLATLVHVAEAALACNPDAAERIQRQEADLEKLFEKRSEKGADPVDTEADDPTPF